MYERVYGEKYNARLSRKEIAALVRGEIKEAVKTGTLPMGKYSVRINRGNSIHVAISGIEAFELISAEWVDHMIREGRYPAGVQRFTAAARKVLETVEGMLAAYNHDGSEIQTDYFDVKFYSSVEFDFSEVEAQTEALRALPAPFLHQRANAEWAERRAKEEAAYAAFVAQHAEEERAAEEKRRHAPITITVTPPKFPNHGLFSRTARMGEA